MIRNAVLLGALFAAACGSTTDSGANALNVRGTWSFKGTQSAPVLTLTGTLRITEQSGSRFSGQVQFIEKDGAGTERARAGTVSGRVAGNDVDFDAVVEGVTRRHVAHVTGENMSGTWVQTAPATLTGAFQADRTATQ